MQASFREQNDAIVARIEGRLGKFEAHLVSQLAQLEARLVKRWW